ncbi:MAG: hypothetical protein SCJ93_10885 [Bacillota bacterium]|nr:hypothetical protein [Bacillota bacterium]
MLNKELRKIKIDINKLKNPKIQNNKLEDAFSIKNKEQDIIEKIELSDKTCPVCGNHLQSGEKICHLCGSNSANIVEDNSDDNFAFKIEKNSKLMKIIIIIVIITLLSLYVFFPVFRYTITEKRVVEVNEIIIEEME